MQGNPRLKPTILKYRVKDDTVLRVNGQLVQIADKEGAVWSLIGLLNGKHTSSQIIKETISKHTELSITTVQEYIDQLKDLDLLEDASLTAEGVIDRYTMERWSRNIEFFGSIAKYGDNKFAYQKKIKEAKICLLGCGGLGTHLLFDLAATGFSNITIVDFDKIEASNLNRQILYHEDDIGKSKVHQAKKRILQFSKQANIKAIAMRLDATEKVASVIAGHDLVICVADKPRNHIIYWLNEGCIKEKVPYINGGLDIRRGAFYSVLPGKSGCMMCWKQTLAQEANDTAVVVNNLDKQLDIDYAIPAPAMVTLVSIVAGCMIAEALKLITGLQPPCLTNKLKAFRFDDMLMETCETWEKQPDCPVCGSISN